MSQDKKSFKPFVAPETNMKELTVKSILVGSLFGVIFGAATVYLALKAGLTVSASIPIAVIAITLGRKFLKTTILENNIIQTTGSAGESIAAGVAFTLPGFLFLSSPSSAEYFNYLTILILAIVGGLLGTLLMVPLRKALIVNEHDNLPYPEGTACGDVLKAGERGGDFAKTAFWGLGVAFVYAIFQKILHVIAETPYYATKQVNKFFPSAKVSGEITPEYLGVGYIIGPRIAGVLVAGGVLSWLVFIPLLSSLVPPDAIASQLVKLGYLADITKAGGKGGWDPVAHSFADYSSAVYYAYIRQIGAGTVAAGGIITLIKTIPTIIKSVKGSLASLKGGGEEGAAKVVRTEKDLSLKIVGLGSLALIVLITVLPQVPGDSILQKLLIGVLVVLFGALFVTVSSRIVGLIGSSNNPISGMTIATVMGTSLIFLSVGWTGQAFEPLVLVVGGMICIAAANAGATSQDLKSGYIVGATPRNQQIALFVGAIVSSIVIGITVKFLDKPTTEMMQQGVQHAIGSEKYPAPQATLMATLIKGILSQNLDWQYVFAGVFLAITMELCGIKSLSFAVGAYLPLATTLPIFIGGAIRGIVENKQKKANVAPNAEEEELSKGSLFATGLVAGGAVAGVIIAFIAGSDGGERFLNAVNCEESIVHNLSQDGYFLLGTVFFAIMGLILYRTAMKKTA
ncbi:OPT family oligopeptide transporter [Sediminibacterium ginsengisoli]|uniref:Putative oligopeptide transporter, OPT family n=1 Tax=Sediminibacterium ginsengisoli TaxID=413434 RepID=A0A1T4NLW7_9BACT|nr:OPT/YSL family transporter [Sediminibacterium ginsengisoli]SJZ80301.1 putative oligopeptide transporter, OPT family [Sediminibacterium ginsengisoli]